MSTRQRLAVALRSQAFIVGDWADDPNSNAQSIQGAALAFLCDEIDRLEAELEGAGRRPMPKSKPSDVEGISASMLGRE